jgi:CheY-specific phosphatase CheX
MIPDQRIEKVLFESVNQIFGDMAFIDAVPNKEQFQVDKDVSIVIEIGFKTPLHGNMLLILPKQVKKTIIENLFAQSWEEVSDEAIDDTFLELLNVIAGMVLTELNDSDEENHLYLPEIIFDINEIADLKDYHFYYFTADDSSFAIALKLLEGE